MLEINALKWRLNCSSFFPLYCQQTLLHGLSDELKLGFLDLALSCKAVICCRFVNIFYIANIFRFDTSFFQKQESQVRDGSRVLCPGVQMLDSTIHCINHCPSDDSEGFSCTYPMDSDLCAIQALNNWGLVSVTLETFWTCTISQDWLVRSTIDLFSWRLNLIFFSLAIEFNILLC